MAFDRAFLDLMSATVSVSLPASRDAYGKTTAATAILTPAKVSYVRRIIRTLNDERIVSTASVHLPPPGYSVSGYVFPVPTVTAESTITLPDNTTRPVVSIEAPFDEDGTPHHQKILLT